MSFSFYRQPLEHQRRDFERFKDKPYGALHYPPRVGKTKLGLDICHYNFLEGRIDGLIVIAYPNGTHRIWLDEAPKDFPPELMARTRVLAWASGKMTSGKMREAALALRAHDGLVILAMNCEAIITDAGWKYLEWFLKKRRVMLVADESSWAKGWTARTRKLLALGRRPNVVSRWILDGSPIDEDPTEIFHPAEFLKPGLLGYSTKTAFRARYTEYETDENGEMVKGRRYDIRTGKVTEYPILKGYRNLDELRDKILSFGSRVRWEDVSDAPSKRYQSRYFELTDKQRRVYDRLRDEYVAELEAGDVSVGDVLTRMTRLQMIARNFFPPERTAESCAECLGSGSLDGDNCGACGGIGAIIRQGSLHRIDSRNPAAEALTEELIASRGPVVVWARFRQDVTDACEAAAGAGRTVLRYDGTMPEADREASYQAFRTGDDPNHVIVGTIGSGLSRGRDLRRAVLLCYYSNTFSLRDRRQSEDRAEGLDRTRSTDVVDLIAADTRDLDVIEALRAKKSLSELVMGDSPTKWI